MSTPNQSLGLNDPGVRLCLIHKVGDYPAAPIGLDHLDADAPIILRDYPVYRVNHAGHYRSPIADLKRPMRVEPLSLVVTVNPAAMLFVEWR